MYFIPACSHTTTPGNGKLLGKTDTSEGLRSQVQSILSTVEAIQLH